MRKNPHILWNHISMKLVEVSLSCLHFSLTFSEGEVKSPCFLQVWWALIYGRTFLTRKEKLLQANIWNTASKFSVLFMSCLSRFSVCNNNQSEICIQYIKCSHWMMIGVQVHISHLKVLWLQGQYYGYLTLASNVFCEIIICKVKRSLCLWINRNN